MVLAPYAYEVQSIEGHEGSVLGIVVQLDMVRRVLLQRVSQLVVLVVQLTFIQPQQSHANHSGWHNELDGFEVVGGVSLIRDLFCGCGVLW